METQTAESIKQRLIEAGGRMSQDLGLGRIVGQTLVYLYLSQEEASLDDISEYLALSKASVSIAARQLERLGMIVRVWKGGDRKSYYRTADNFTKSLQKGLVEYFQQKLSLVGSEIDRAQEILNNTYVGNDPGAQFLFKRVKRAAELKNKAEKMFCNPVVGLFLEK